MLEIVSEETVMQCIELKHCIIRLSLIAVCSAVKFSAGQM